NTDGWAKAGLMMRDGLANNAIYAATLATPGNGIVRQARDTTGAGSNNASFSRDPNSGSAPFWVSLERSGNDFHSRWAYDYYGQPLIWSAPESHTIAAMPASANIGLASTSHNGGVTGTTVFDNVQLTGATLAAPIPVPPPYTSEDIGSPAPAGSAQYLPSTGTLHIAGGGADIWGTSDQFHYVHLPESGDFSAVVQLYLQENTNGWAKAGIMARDGTAADAAHVNVSATPGAGVNIQWRDTAGGGSGGGGLSGSPNTTAGPVWLYLSRDGDTFTSRWAPDDNGQPGFWQTSATHTSALNTNLEIGLHNTSHNTGALSHTVFAGMDVGDWEAVSTLTGSVSGRVRGQALGRDVPTNTALGPAHWRLDAARVLSTTPGLQAEWYTNTTFTDPPAVVTTATEINRNDYDYPGTGWVGDQNNFSVRYSGMFYFGGGSVSFQEQVDDEAWLDIDGVEVLHDGTWNVNTNTTISLDEGWHGIEFRQREGGGGDFARLFWDPTGGTSWAVMDTTNAQFMIPSLGAMELISEGWSNVGDLLTDDFLPGGLLPMQDLYLAQLTVDYWGETAVAQAYLFGVPEPGTMTLLAIGGIGALVRRRRRRQARA
ncbi:PEP-CTERM sorting domain-containing protein, partial [bacterium]|nr:PEP-CTERM sorting domain-containing protein [bacterium]